MGDVRQGLEGRYRAKGGGDEKAKVGEDLENDTTMEAIGVVRIIESDLKYNGVVVCSRIS